MISNTTGWLKYNTESEAEGLVTQINNCLGFPTADGRTTTWDIPLCLQNDYSPDETESGWFVTIKNECYDCLTEGQKADMLTTLPYDILCGTTAPTTGNTENYL